MPSWTDTILGALTNPGTTTSTAEEALGIPLALFGSYELARGVPIGAPASLLGGGLSALGYQGYQTAADRESLVRGYKAYQPYFDYKKIPADQFAGMDPEIQKGMVKAASQWAPNVGVFRNIVKTDPTSEQAKTIIMFGGPEAAADAGVSAKAMFEKMAAAGAGGKAFMNEGLGDTLLRMGVDPLHATEAQKEAAARQQQADAIQKAKEERQNAATIAAGSRVPREGSFTPLYDTSGNIIGRWDAHSGTPVMFPHPLKAGTKTPGKPAFNKGKEQDKGGRWWLVTRRTDLPGAPVVRVEPTTETVSTFRRAYGSIPNPPPASEFGSKGLGELPPSSSGAGDEEAAPGSEW